VEGTLCKSRWMPKEGCDPMGSLHWSRFLAGPVDPWREKPTLEQVCWQFLKDCNPWKGPTLGQFMKSCSPWEGLTLEKFVENCLP